MSVAILRLASRAICLLGIRTSAVGASLLCVGSGLPDLITAATLARKPGFEEMAAANAFGMYAFNAWVALGLPWVLVGIFADVFPPARGTFFPGLLGFCAVSVSVLAVLACKLHLSRGLGVFLLLLYVGYLTLVLHDGFSRIARPPEF